MALLTILEYPDPRLRTRAVPVTTFDAALSRLIDDMFETMYDAPGSGLAATQVDVHLRLLVLDVSEDKNRPLVFINPEVRVLEGGTRTPFITRWPGRIKPGSVGNEIVVVDLRGYRLGSLNDALRLRPV